MCKRKHDCKSYTVAGGTKPTAATTTITIATVTAATTEKTRTITAAATVTNNDNKYECIMQMEINFHAQLKIAASFSF